MGRSRSVPAPSDPGAQQTARILSKGAAELHQRLQQRPRDDAQNGAAHGRALLAEAEELGETGCHEGDDEECGAQGEGELARRAVEAEQPAERRGACGEEDAALFSDGAWRRLFGGRLDVVGKTVHLDGRAVRVAGVMPRGFNAPPQNTDIWLPLQLTAADLADDNRGNENLVMIARLRPGVTIGEGQAEMDVITAAVRNRIKGDTEALAAAIKPLIRAPGEGAWTDAAISEQPLRDYGSAV